MTDQSRFRFHASRFTLSDVNRMDRMAFVADLGYLFEASPWIAERAWDARSFDSVEALHEALCAVMYGATTEEKLSLIRAHPDLVGRAAQAGTLTPESVGEQAS